MANPYALDFNPLASAISDNQQLDLARNRLAMDQKRLGFEEKRLGWEGELQPFRVESARLGNVSAQQGVTREDKMLPLDITAKKGAIAGQGLQNQSTAQSIEGKRMELEKELAGRVAGIAQMWEGKPEAEQKAMLGKLYATDPRFQAIIGKYIPKEVAGDPVVVGRTLRALASGYQAPQIMPVEKDKALVNIQRDPNDPMAPAKPTVIFKNDGNDQFKDEHQLRGELSGHPTVKNFAEIKSGYGRMLEGQNAKSGAGDLAIVYGYMKMLDPTSVVREGEFATAEKTAGVPEQVRIMYNKVLNGERLSDTVRQNFLGMSDGLYKRAESDVAKVQDQYRTLAKNYKLRPDNVIIDQGIATPPKQESNLPKFNPAPRGMQDVVNGRGVEKSTQERVPQPAQQTQMPRLQRGPAGDATYNALPSGARFIDPDGNERIKR